MTVAAAKLSEVFTTSTLSGVLDELIAVIPTVVPVAIGFLGIRKAISFVIGLLQQA